MKAVAARIDVNFKNILYLTDFSAPSEAALPFALAITREFGAQIHALNLLIPPGYVYTTPELTALAIEAEEETAVAEMRKVETRLAGLPHETLVERATEVWEPVKRAILERKIDLIVLGTNGRTGTQRLLLGSIAEKIFRLSPVPVLTIGPNVRGCSLDVARFRRVLFATDFSPEAAAAAAYAISLARRQNAHLILVHVLPKSRAADGTDASRVAISVAEAMHRLYEIPSKDATLNAPPELALEYGDPADRIVEAAKLRDADIIVLGIRAPSGVPGAASHLERPTAHRVVVNAPCPVLAVRG
jgi:nucleotide-binding universal stress UspA family protein